MTGADPPEQLSQGLVRLDIVLPALAVTATRLKVRLRPLAVVRGIRRTTDGWTLHLRFVVRLPADLGEVLACLEKRR
jgi:hypothetical protein